ncbi:MAG: class II fructose-bisphosphate aldolase [Christensenellales bacterium]
MRKLKRYNELLQYAQEHQFTVPGFNIFNMETAQAVIKASDEMNVPVIIQIYSGDISHTDGPAMIKAIVEAEIQTAEIDVALGLDHGRSFEEAKLCVDSGFTGVMIDLSSQDYSYNVRQTIETVKYAHERGVSVEAELGIISNGDSDPKVLEQGFTDPKMARQFVMDTGVDCLAVAIGTAHGVYKTKPRIDFDLLQELIECVPCPIVVHGGSGTPDDDVERMVRMGIAKLNIGTDLFIGYNKGLIKTMEGKEPDKVRAVDASATARDEVYKVAQNKLEILTRFRK